jgi:glycosyltransferase involved in cell wall biosynthesis
MSSRFNGFEWIEGFKKYDIATSLVVLNKQSNSNFVELLSKSRVRRGSIARLFARRLKKLGYQIEYLPWASELFNLKSYQEADIVHLQIVLDGTLDFRTISRIQVEKKVIWTWHDLSATTSHCVTPMDCDNWKKSCIDCPDLQRPFPVDISRGNVQVLKKKQLATNTDRIHVASSWMIQLLDSNANFADLDYLQIPFGIDATVFYPEKQKKLKLKLGIGDEKFVLGFRQTADVYKNFRFISRMLDIFRFPSNLVILTIGETGLLENHKNNRNIHIIELPWTNDNELLRDFYNALDYFISPSRFESFGLMSLEAMACGTPVIGVAGGAIAEICQLEKYGTIVQDGDIAELRNLIEKMVDNPEARIDRQILAKFVHDEYGLNSFLERFATVYHEMVQN